MKKIITTILTVLLAATIAAAAITFLNMSSASKNIVIRQDAIRHDTSVTFECLDEVSQGESFTVKGRVIDTVTGQGVAGAEVSVIWNGNFNPDSRTFTDSDGYFVKEKVAPDTIETEKELRVTFMGR